MSPRISKEQLRVTDAAICQIPAGTILEVLSTLFIGLTTGYARRKIPTLSGIWTYD
tara:strand:- start:14441 stop:14608 length:168 start_codon:yes stop_codon:yes gene_type:complete